MAELGTAASDGNDANDLNNSWFNTVDVIKCVALFYKLGSSAKDFIRKEKFRIKLPRSVRKVANLKELVR